MQLIKLLPEQVMNHWDQIRASMELALPPHVVQDSDSMLQVQQQLLVGELECWLAIEDLKSNVIYGIMTTQFVFDQISNCKNLLVYSITTIAEHPQEMWEFATEKMLNYARAKECHNIIAYSNNAHMISIAERLGADSSYRLLIFNTEFKK